MVPNETSPRSGDPTIESTVVGINSGTVRDCSITSGGWILLTFNSSNILVELTVLETKAVVPPKLSDGFLISDLKPDTLLILAVVGASTSESVDNRY